MFGSKQIKAVRTSGVVIESLENRQFFSTVSDFAAVAPAPQATPAIVVSQSHVTTKAEAAAAKAAAKLQAATAKAEAKEAKAAATAMAKLIKVEAKLAVKATKAGAAPTNQPIFTTQDVFGSWEGTFTSVKGRVTKAFGVDFTIRHPANNNMKTQGFTGSFDLSAMIGNGDTKTTITMSRSQDVRVLIRAGTADVSFTGGLSLNGKQIVGRYSVLSNGRYEVGSFVLNKM